MTARKSALRAVKPGESGERAKTLLQAVDTGDYLAELKATHRRIAKTVNDEGTSPRDLAALTRRQLEISKEIKALELAREQEAAGGDAAPDEAFDPASAL